MKKEISNVEEYIDQFPNDVQVKLHLIRNTIKKHAPNAVESISYGMPAYKLNKKPLIYFGGYANHIGLYATPSGHKKFKTRLSKYKQGKGSVQFTLDSPLPIDLIAEIILFRVIENTSNR